MTERTHPGGYSGETFFSDFEPFIKTGDVPLWVKQKFFIFLQELFEQTKIFWIPRGCAFTHLVEEQAGNLLKEDRFSGIKVEPRRWIRATHFWLVATFEGFDRELVIDPAGVITPGADYYQQPQTIVPFFGDKNLAPYFSKDVYSQGELLGERGY